MYSLFKKRGIEAAGFSVIVSIIILLLSAAVILAVIRYQASKVDEQLQVDLCRISNEIKFGFVEKKTSGLISGPEICNTIDKTEKKSMIPTKKYKQNKEGAEAEIREMIKNCWYMWLDGTEKNMFKQYPFSEGCFACYTFKIKDDIKGVNFKSLEESVQEPFFAEDRSDKCSPVGGFWRPEKCEEDEKSIKSSKKAPGDNFKCCIKKDVKNVCENKGGKCSSTGAPPDFPRIYNKWSCPKRTQSCYVEENSLYSYINYIRKFGARGGEIFFISPGEETQNINFIPGEIYSVSFVSPNKVLCWKVDGVQSCLASIGEDWYIPVTIGAVAGVGILASVYAPVAALTTAILTIVGKATLNLAALFPLATTVGTATGIYFIGDISKAAADFITSPVAADAPNFIIVSTLENARKLECAVEYTAK